MGKKILYINFNMIMHPFLNIYLHHINDTNSTPNDTWEYLNKKLNLYEFVQYDVETLMQLTNLLNRFATKKNFKNSVPPSDLIKSLRQEDELVYIDFENSFKTAKCQKTWIYSCHSDINNNLNDLTLYNLDNLTQLFELKYKFDEVYFYFPPKQVPYKFYHLYQLLKKFGIKR